MKITFICGSLAPGKDGVGDYTRCLASACAAAGHEVQLVLICDIERDQSQSGGISVERFCGALTGPAMEQCAAERIQAWSPDWISLQFVPFAFHPKGLSRSLQPFIKQLCDIAPLHIMFHELWLGEKPSLSLKHKVLGRIQRHQILKALRNWQPQSIHTSNQLYVDVLKRNGITARLLPLFGNIPVAEKDPETLQQILPWYPARPNERIVLFPFSQSMSWQSAYVMERLKQFANAADVSLRLIQIGKNQSGEAHWPRIREFAQANGWSCDVLGPQSEQVISQLMQIADLGVSSAHIQLAGKSGAVIGMMEHGLPVFCTSLDPESRHPVSHHAEDLLFDFEQSDSTMVNLLKEPKAHKAQSRLSTVAAQWLKDLEDARKHG